MGDTFSWIKYLKMVAKDYQSVWTKKANGFSSKI